MRKYTYIYLFLIFQYIGIESVLSTSIINERDFFGFNHSIYNTLSSVEEANLDLKSREDFDLFLSESKQLAHKYGLEEIMGLRLIHRHTLLDKNEAIIEQNQSFENKPALITYKKDLKDIESAFPASWILKDNHFYVFEYSSDEKVKSSNNVLKHNSDFFYSYASLLSKYNYETLLALSIVDREWYKNYVGETLFLERSYSDDDQFFSVITAEALDKLSLSKSIQTAWPFTKTPISHKCTPTTVCIPEKANGGGHATVQRHKSSS